MPLAPPTYDSPEHFRSRRADVVHWGPLLDEVLDRHDLRADAAPPEAGFNATYPTFLVGDVVVKLFGGHPGWRAAHTTEHAALRLLAGAGGLAVPELLAEGRLFEDPETPWPYIVTRRVRGVPWHEAELTPAQERALVADLGRWTRQLHSLRPEGVPPAPERHPEEVVAAHRASALPARLVDEIPTFLERVPPGDAVLVHGDLVGMHVFVEDGRLSAVIDWGDAVVADRHRELGKLHLGALCGDAALLRILLEASEWPVPEDFSRRALAEALRRQADGRAQHFSFDVFHRMPTRVDLDSVASLDALSTLLFPGR